MTAKQTLWQLGIEIDKHDAWGTAMGALFDIAHAIEHYGTDYPPAHWQYRDSPICHGLPSSADARATGEDAEARTIAAAILRGCEAEIIHAGNVLDRYTSILRHAGRDY